MNSSVRFPVIYLRKSHLSNADNDLEAHERRALAKMQERGEANPTIIKEKEGHRSAYTENRRPGYQEVETLIAEGKVTTLYVNDRGRIWRNALEWLPFLTLCLKHGTEVVPSIEVPVGDISDPNQQLLEFLHGWQAERYRTQVSMSLRATKDDFRKAGIPTGNTPPYGMKLVGKMFDRHYEPSDDFPFVLELLELYLEGHGGDTVAMLMNTRGRTWKIGQRRKDFTGTSVRHLINQIEVYEPFLDALFCEKVKVRRAEAKGYKMNGARAKRGRLLCTRLLRCRRCGCNFFGRHILPGQSKGYKNAVDAYLHPKHTPCDTPRRWIRADFVHAAVWAQLETLHENISRNADHIFDALDDTYKTERQELDYAMTRQALDDELLTLRRNYNRGDFGDTDLPATRSYFQNEQSRIIQGLDALKAPPPNALPSRALITREIVEELHSTPLAVLRFQAEAEPQKGNDWLRRIVDSIEIDDLEISVRFVPELQVNDR